MEYKISENTIKNIEELQTSYFQLNKYWDRFMSVADTKFAMKNFVRLAHPRIAHAYFFASDLFGDILSKYNIPTVYDTVYREDKDFTSVGEGLEGNLERNLMIVDLFNAAIEEAVKNGERQVSVELSKLMRLHNEFVDQAYLLVDKYKSCRNDCLFDGFAEQYVLRLDEKVTQISEGGAYAGS